jgi:hypothetical protein
MAKTIFSEGTITETESYDVQQFHFSLRLMWLLVLCTYIDIIEPAIFSILCCICLNISRSIHTALMKNGLSSDFTREGEGRGKRGKKIGDTRSTSTIRYTYIFLKGVIEGFPS